MKIKKCTKCGEEKSADLFTKHPFTRDGLGSWCKSCHFTTKKKWEGENRDKVLEYHRIYNIKNSEKIRLERLDYREKFPEVVRAHHKLNNAIKRGEVERQPCEVCGAIKSEAHHDDYSKPFDVRWLCRSHHLLLHSRLQKDVK